MHSFVEFEEHSDSTDIIIDASALTQGEVYQLTLESFNTLSRAKSTLKTDKINIVIVGPAVSTLLLPSFEQELSAQIILEGP